jgi:hypothetical protein
MVDAYLLLLDAERPTELGGWYTARDYVCPGMFSIIFSQM